MAGKSFVHLHNHSQFSLLDGASKLEELVEQAARYDMPAVAVTDHGNLFGAIPFFEAATEKGIKPILGCETYVAPGPRTDRTPGGAGKKPYYHLLLLARDLQGYQNLMKLSTAGFLEGYYYRPRIDRDLLSRHAGGLIATSTCLGGEIPQLILAGRHADAERVACEYRELFGPENFFFEIQDQGIPEETSLNEVLVPMGRRLRIPLLATNDCHFLNRDDHFAHDILICIQTGKTVKDADRMRFTQEHYFKSSEEMRKVFKSLPDAVDNTLVVAERCNLTIPMGGNLLPHFQVPEGKTAEEYFREVTARGFEERLPAWKALESQGMLRVPMEEYRRRLESEIDMIVRMGFPGYFLIVWDFIKYARDRGIPVGPGRGSSAGSLVAYCLRITDVDPLRYDLLFERFLNPERITMPDIDIDFCMRGRGEVIDYVRDKYGRENVAQIITFATLGAKAVIRDAGRGLDIPYGDCDRIAKLVPAEPDMTIDKAIQTVPALRQTVEKEQRIRQLLDVSKRLEGLTRHASVHAAGVVISPRPIVEFSPLARTRDDEIVTQYAMDEIGSIGLLKMDFLGLKTLTLVHDCVACIKEDESIDIDIEALPLDDPGTYACFQAARTDGVFQFESSGMKDILRKLKPDRFEDLIALNALFRPGPIGSGMIDDYVERRHGRKAIEFIVPQMEAILGVTYGVIVYQEQVMQIASRLAGFTLGEADILRRAMGKKKKDVMAAQRDTFVKGCRLRDVGEKDARRIFDLMEHFAGYGFNKAHSTAYALIAYRTAWLKAHFPRHFMASLLTMEKDNTDNIVKYIAESRDMGIAVLPPHVNGSGIDFTVESEGIRFGLGAVKNVGEGAARMVVEARQRHGPFGSLADLCREVDLRTVNKRVLESLVKAGTLDGLGANRATVVAALDAAIETGQKAVRDRESGQVGLFGGIAAGASSPALPPFPEWPEKDRLLFEKETLGFYMTGHPFREYVARLEGLVTHTTIGLKEISRPRKVTLAGIVSALKRRKTRRGDPMAVFHLEDLEGAVEVIVFPETYSRHKSLLEDDAALMVNGNVEIAEDQRRVIAESFLPLDRAEEKVKEIVIAIPSTGLVDSAVGRIRDLLGGRPGPCPVYLEVTEPRSFRVTLRAGNALKISPSRDLTLALEDLLGKGAVRFR
ncbi:MAG: DNA polymerase III subunit alpha [Acidobacteria bacterium 13_1_40CM_2_68_10]|nr:MAG: DNA polymerase III subunit alpha [Acidobacteria bacterium 13_1_40CM_2_68_10]OLE66160.1 MAG: DNA polymerase III subunit alpha [Acidobacteria bacterium 13_1_20CM_2_68_14]